MERTALVTGGTGFVGSHLVKRLIADGWRVHVVVRPDSDCTKLSTAVNVHVHDHSTDGMLAIMQRAKPDIVFHLASLFVSEHEISDVTPLIQSNLIFGTQLAEAMARENVNLIVNTGTSWQHYKNHEYNPVNLYAATKQAFESLLQYYINACELRVVTLELFDTYGPDDPRPKLINLLKNLSMKKQQLAMSPGEQCVDLVHVDDVIDAFNIAAERLLNGRVVEHERYAVSSGKIMTLHEIVELLERLLGYQLPIVWGARSYRKREVMIPWSGGIALPGWSPKIALTKGLTDSIEFQADCSL